MSSHILATGSYDRSIRLWEVSSGFCYRTIAFQDSQVNKIAISSTKQYLIAGGNPMIRLFELGNNNPSALATFNGHKNNVVGLGFLQHNRVIYSGSEDGTIKLWDIRSASLSRDFEKAEEACSFVTILPSEKYLLSTYQHGMLKILEHSSGISKDIYLDGEKPLQYVSVDSTGQYCSIANLDGEIMIYYIGKDPLVNFELVHKWKAHNKYVLKCSYNSDSSLFSTVSADQSIKIWNVKGKDYILQSTLEGHTKWIWDCAFSSLSNYFISSSSDLSARLWDLETGETHKIFSGHRKAVSCLALNDSDSG